MKKKKSGRLGGSEVERHLALSGLKILMSSLRVAAAASQFLNKKATELVAKQFLFLWAEVTSFMSEGFSVVHIH